MTEAQAESTARPLRLSAEIETFTGPEARHTFGGFPRLRHNHRCGPARNQRRLKITGNVMRQYAQSTEFKDPDTIRGGAPNTISGDRDVTGVSRSPEHKQRVPIVHARSAARRHTQSAESEQFKACREAQTQSTEFRSQHIMSGTASNTISENRTR